MAPSRKEQALAACHERSVAASRSGVNKVYNLPYALQLLIPYNVIIVSHGPGEYVGRLSILHDVAPPSAFDLIMGFFIVLMILARYETGMIFSFIG